MLIQVAVMSVAVPILETAALTLIGPNGADVAMVLWIMVLIVLFLRLGSASPRILAMEVPSTKASSSSEAVIEIGPVIIEASSHEATPKVSVEETSSASVLWVCWAVLPLVMNSVVSTAWLISLLFFPFLLGLLNLLDFNFGFLSYQVLSVCYFLLLFHEVLYFLFRRLFQDHSN